MANQSILSALVFLFLCTHATAQQKSIISLSTEKGASYMVFDDENLVKTYDGFLLSGKLAKNAVVEEPIDMRTLIPFECKPRVHQISDPVLIAPAGSIISFTSWMYNQALHGYLQVMTIGNGKPMLIRAWGFKNGIALPNGSQIYFATLTYCEEGCTPKRAAVSYWISYCRFAVLGADTRLPGLGLVKKGTMVKFSGAKTESCAEAEINGPGKIEIVNESNKKALLNDWYYRRG